MLGEGRRMGLRGGGDGREGRRRLQRSAAGEEERREGEREAKLEVAGWGSAQLEEREALGSRGKDEIRGGRGGGGGAEGGGGKEAEEEEGEGIGAPGSGPLEEEEGGEGDKEGRKEREETAESGDDGGDRPAEEQALPSEETKISLEHFLGCQQVGSVGVFSVNLCRLPPLLSTSSLSSSHPSVLPSVGVSSPSSGHCPFSYWVFLLPFLPLPSEPQTTRVVLPPLSLASHSFLFNQILTDLEKNVRRKGPWTPGPIEDVRQD